MVNSEVVRLSQHGSGAGLPFRGAAWRNRATGAVNSDRTAANSTPERPWQGQQLKNDRLGSSSVEKVLAGSKQIISQQRAQAGKANRTPGCINTSLASR